MYLAIEIGGTKLQVAVGRDGALAEVARAEVEREGGAERILRQIAAMAGPLMERYRPSRAGIAFGGPVDEATGRVIKSHQVAGWDEFDLAGWCQRELGLPAVVGNDADLAALAEATYGAGRGYDPVFYVTVGTGIGGGLVIGGKSYRGGARARAEIGHLRPGLDADDPSATLESLASGPAIAAAVQRRLTDSAIADDRDRADFVRRCNGQLDRLTTKQIAAAATAGNTIARDALDHACRALGWGIAQAITLVAPQVVVVGGGVSLAGEELFFQPLRAAVARYVFPPLAGRYQIVPAALGEEVMLWGALALAAV